MPTKKMIIVFLLGWSLAVLIPPQKILGMFGNKGNQS